MRQALGKGLDALLGGTPLPQDGAVNNAPTTTNGIQKISVDQIIANRYQPRKTFNDESLQELANSIKQHGLTQPVVVMYDTGLDKYELVVGERRFRASKLAGFTEIDCIVHHKLDEKQLCALALIENIQREDLNPIETALGYRSLMQKFMLSQTDLVEYCGKSKAAISNSLRLLTLNETMQAAIQSGEITEGHGKALLMLPDNQKREILFKKMLATRMSVRQAEQAARDLIEPKEAAKRDKNPDTLAFEQALQEVLGTKVELKYGSNPAKGSLIVHYNSIEELETLAEKLRSKML